MPVYLPIALRMYTGPLLFAVGYLEDAAGSLSKYALVYVGLADSRLPLGMDGYIRDPKPAAVSLILVLPPQRTPMHPVASPTFP